jgi:hypothetical protein
VHVGNCTRARARALTHAHTHKKWSPVEIQTPARRNLIVGRLLLPSRSLLRLPSHPIALSCVKQKIGAFKKYCVFFIALKLRISETV